MNIPWNGLMEWGSNLVTIGIGFGMVLLLTISIFVMVGIPVFIIDKVITKMEKKR